MTKEEVFELIKESIKELLRTNILFWDDKPEFMDIQDYRKSLLELISKLIDFYKEV